MALVGLAAGLALLAAPALGQPAVVLSDSAFDFGGQSMNTTSAQRFLTIRNVGAGPLAISDITIDESQFLLGGSCGVVAAGGECTVAVRFKPAVALGALNSTVAVQGTLGVVSNALGSPHTVALAGTAEKSLVTHYYQAILGRVPDAGGKTYWSGEAERVAGSLGANVNETWFAMAMTFYYSVEYANRARDNAGYVTDLYITFFNRQPDTGGQAFWTGQLDQGLPREVALAEFMFSLEFGNFTQAIFGNTAVRGEIDLVTDFYRGLLARLPDDAGFQFWLAHFRLAQCQGAGQVAATADGMSRDFVGGAEYGGRARTDAQFVGDLYNAFLRRGGDLDGVNFWIDQLATHTRDFVRQQFVASPEFQARVTKVVQEGCFDGGGGGGSGSLRVSVGGFGYVSSAPTGISCGHVPNNVPGGGGTRCHAGNLTGTVTLTAQPFNGSFQFAGWAGDTTCTTNPTCDVPMANAKWVRAKFTASTLLGNACQAMGLVSDKDDRPLRRDYPDVPLFGSFVDPNFGTTIRRITNVAADGRGPNKTLVPAYSTISAWNSDETYLILYRTDGANSGHELFDGRTYQFIRKLDDLVTADLEQFYWDTTRPNVVYGVNSERRVMVKYDVDAARGQRVTELHDFSAQCGIKPLHGGSDPFFSSWDSRVFALACVAGNVMSYDPVGDIVTGVGDPVHPSTESPQALPSGTRLFLTSREGVVPRVQVFGLDFTPGPYLDQQSPYEHAGTSRNFNGDDTHNASAFGPGPSGTGEGSVVQWNYNTAPNLQNRIRGRVIVGPATGYPYPPTGTHLSGVSFNRTGLLGVSIVGDAAAASLLHGELLYIDADPETNPGDFVCRVGHHRSVEGQYFAEPHVTISPSGTRLLFGSSWGTGPALPTIDSYVVELPGYRP